MTSTIYNKLNKISKLEKQLEEQRNNAGTSMNNALTKKNGMIIQELFNLHKGSFKNDLKKEIVNLSKKLLNVSNKNYMNSAIKHAKLKDYLAKINIHGGTRKKTKKFTH